MSISIFAIYDRVASTYGTPFYSVNTQTAMRAVSHEVNHTNSMLAQNAADFELFELGSFDQDTCDFALFGFPARICSCAAFVVPEPPRSAQPSEAESVDKEVN